MTAPMPETLPLKMARLLPLMPWVPVKAYSQTPGPPRRAMMELFAADRKAVAPVMTNSVWAEAVEASPRAARPARRPVLSFMALRS